MIKFVAISVPAVAVGTSVQPVENVKPLEEVVSGRDERDALALPELPGADSVFLLIDVDSAAKRYAWSAAPAFPPKMLEKKISGFVRAEWVVQPDGSADTASLRIVETTHAEFAQAVRDALPYMRFSPAKIGRKPVSQLVQQEFTFRISVAATDSQQVRKPNP
jgi:TonB family protein